MSLTFVTPALLAGAAFVAAPIILHLVMRQKPRRLEFPALRFVQRRLQAEKRRLRLRHWLLLVLRCLAILFIALAVARPALLPPGATGIDADRLAVAMVFDNSPRMGYLEDNSSSLERAKELGRAVLRDLAAGTEIWVFEARPELTNSVLDAPIAKERVERLELTNESMPLRERVEDALARLKESQAGRKELYVFSDLARAAWQSVRGGPWKALLSQHDDVRVFIVDVGAATPRNLSLGDVVLAGQRITTTTPLAVQTSLLASGLTTADAVAAELYLGKDGELTKRAESNITPQEDGSAEVRWPPLTGLDAGIHQGEIRLLVNDGLEVDNTRFFTIEVTPPVPILLASPEPTDRFAGLFAQAIAPEALRQQQGARFIPQVVPVTQLEAANLSDFGAVVLLDPYPLSATAWRNLAEFVAQGGGLAIVLGRNATTDGFNESASAGLLPGGLVRVWRAGDRANTLVIEDFQHPLVADFRAGEGNVPWQAFPILRHWQFTEPLLPGTQVVARFSQGDPAVLERSFHQGNVVTIATTLSDAPSDDDPWNSLITGWPGFVLANSVVDYLVLGRDVILNYPMGASVTLPARDEAAPASLVITRPDGGEEVVIAPVSNRAMTLPPGGAPGNYRVRFGEGDSTSSLGFSMNVLAAQTDLDRIPAAELLDLLGKERVSIARGLPELTRSTAVSRGGTELFSWLMTLVSIVVLAEGLLSNRFYRRAPTPRAA